MIAVGGIQLIVLRLLASGLLVSSLTDNELNVFPVICFERLCQSLHDHDGFVGECCMSITLTCDHSLLTTMIIN